MWIRQRGFGEPGFRGRVQPDDSRSWDGRPAAHLGMRALALAGLVLAAFAVARGQNAVVGQSADSKANAAADRRNLPPRVVEAQRFLDERGWTHGNSGSRASRVNTRWRGNSARPQAQPAGNATATWQALGPNAVLTPNFGLVTGRISALALDPTDATGNRLFLGTTGGGVWLAQNAGATTASSVAFTPLTDSLAAISGVMDASISIGALTVQPGGTGVILAGTGDPNDALDSYYGAGILRSADGGKTWILITSTEDKESGLGFQDYSFTGEGFAGFAWSTVNPQQVVAAVSQAFEGTLVNADLPTESYEGLYYSADGGVTWHLAIITDGNGFDVQGPNDLFTLPRQSRLSRLHRLSHLSRNAGRESRDRRYLCLDCGRVQPGPGVLAGPVRNKRRRLRKPGHCVFAPMEYGGAGNKHRRRAGHDCQWRLQPGARGGAVATGHAAAGRGQ